MDEEKTIENANNPTENTGEGNKYETTPIIERARQENERLEKNIANQKIENDRAELIMAKKELGGDSEGGQEPVKKEETPLEYRDRIDKEISEGKHGD